MLPITLLFLMVPFALGARSFASTSEFAFDPEDVTFEKNIGIQEYKQDTSLNDEEVAMIAAWADNGSPEGDPADLPPAGRLWAGSEIASESIHLSFPGARSSTSPVT